MPPVLRTTLLSAAAVLAAGAALAAEAAWVELFKNPNATVSYRSLGPSPLDAKLVRVQVRGEFNQPQNVGGLPVRTQQNVYDIDCATRRVRRMQTIVSTEPGLAGQQRKEDYTTEPWRTPTPGDTVSSQIVARTCPAPATAAPAAS